MLQKTHNCPRPVRDHRRRGRSCAGVLSAPHAMVGSQPLPGRTATTKTHPVGNDATPRMDIGEDVLRLEEVHTSQQPASVVQVRMGRGGERPTAGNVGRGIRRGDSPAQGVQMVITKACPLGRAFVFATTILQVFAYKMPYFCNKLQKRVYYF